MNLLPITRGSGSQKHPLIYAEKFGVDHFRKTLAKICIQFKECWVLGSDWDTRNQCAHMFDEGFIMPIPPVARQDKRLIRYQLTGLGEKAYG